MVSVNTRANGQTNGSERLKAKKQGCKSFFQDLKNNRRGKSAKVTLLILYGFLDTEKHGGEPLVQPRNGVKFLHLRK